MSDSTASPSALSLRRHKSFLPEFGFGRSRLYCLITEHKFPPPRKMGSRTSVWPSTLIEDAKQQILEHGDWSIDRVEDPELKQLAEQLVKDY
ncbi:MAG: AlpA family phage regulatory protein [Gammaproteobacteria bacterium]|nr:AlpA family phage regulatory protein [Gammaproteobacteria bacterium]MDX2486193.1 AlpA family phage regulatory protein [Gammaproteobacteria bacterium]